MPTFTECFEILWWTVLYKCKAISPIIIINNPRYNATPTGIEQDCWWMVPLVQCAGNTWLLSRRHLYGAQGTAQTGILADPCCAGGSPLILLSAQSWWICLFSDHWMELNKLLCERLSPASLCKTFLAWRADGASYSLCIYPLLGHLPRSLSIFHESLGSLRLAEMCSACSVFQWLSNWLKISVGKPPDRWNMWGSFPFLHWI